MMIEQNNDGMFNEPPVVINIGLNDFAEALIDQGVEVVQVDWVPPAGGDQQLMDILDKLL
jgi:hypothetical protein